MRCIIGIDLGTTNSSVAYFDCHHPARSIQNFYIPQLVSTGYVEQKATLPSFYYLTTEGEWPTASLDLPWQQHLDFFVGHMAQVEGAKVPTRLVQSAKSWLCHSTLNRQDPILPFEASAGDRKVSPVEATMRYLAHIKEAWDYQIAKGDHQLEFAEQEIVLTVPASFDEIARSLTAMAAKQAGYKHLTLLEEPQAAFYAWLANHEQNWQELLPPGSCILVCDVGGGTTDFSLIEVSTSNTHVQLQRMAVGDHLLLGGDNLDTFIAHQLEKQILMQEANLQQWSQLKQQARLAKEALLSEGSLEEKFSVVLQGKGASIIAGSHTGEITRRQLVHMLMEGFFGQYTFEEALKLRRKIGMRTVGLPYEEEPSITKHIANFLQQSAGKGPAKGPDFVLFNGGTLKPQLFQQAIMDAIKSWFPEKSPQVLVNTHFDLAVSRGAAYYGKVRRGLGVRISGGAARSYYLGLEIKQPDQSISYKALTLLPRGCEEGSSYEPAHTFWLKPNAAVQFQLYSSHVRLEDQSGDLVEIAPTELHALPPIHTLLRFGKKQADSTSSIPVHLHIHLNAIGTLELTLKAQNTTHQWSLEFQLRSASGQENSLATIDQGQKGEIIDQALLQKGIDCLTAALSRDSSIKPAKIMEVLETTLARPRREWSPHLLRALWKPLANFEQNRKRSPEWEARWWHLTGFCLRPGFGFPLDDFRLKELWKIILADSKEVKAGSDLEVQKLICYRRIAAGLSKGQQLQIAHEILPTVLSKKGSLLTNKNGSNYSHTEKLRTLASLELIDHTLKEKLGAALVDRICTAPATSAEYWALARIGARHLFHGSLSNVIRPQTCSLWIEKLLKAHNASSADMLFVMLQLARKSDSREINLPTDCIHKILQAYAHTAQFEHVHSLLTNVSAFTAHEQELVFGEQLPTGLSLHFS